MQYAIRKPWSGVAPLALAALTGCGGAAQNPAAPIGVSTSAPVAFAPNDARARSAAVSPAPAAADWSKDLQPWSGSSGHTHLYGEPSATWTTYANAGARSLLEGAVRRAPSGAEFVAKIVSNTAGTAWLRMRKVQDSWVYDALDNGEPASLRALSTCASCHVQSSADSVYFSPTK